MPPAPKVWSTADSFLAGFFRSRMELMESCPCRRENCACCRRWCWGVVWWWVVGVYMGRQADMIWGRRRLMTQ
jgi:hypothetical protein